MLSKKILYNVRFGKLRGVAGCYLLDKSLFHGQEIHPRGIHQILAGERPESRLRLPLLSTAERLRGGVLRTLFFFRRAGKGYLACFLGRDAGQTERRRDLSRLWGPGEASRLLLPLGSAAAREPKLYPAPKRK